MFTRHAKTRCQQRGKRPDFIQSILEHADIDRPAGDNCRIQRVSRPLARSLNLDDRLPHFALVISDDSQKIVTLVPINGAGGKRYSRMQ